MPIIGGEIVRVRFLPPGGDDTDERDLVFRIAKISNVTIVEKRQHFNLHLLSYAGFKNITTRISRASFKSINSEIEIHGYRTCNC